MPTDSQLKQPWWLKQHKRPPSSCSIIDAFAMLEANKQSRYESEADISDESGQSEVHPGQL